MERVKKLLLFFLLLAVILGVTGCLRLQTTIDLEMDGSGNLNYDLGLNSMLYRMVQLDDDMSLEQLQNRAEERGYEVENYEDEEFTGLNMNKNFADLEELQQELGLLGIMAPGALEDDVDIEEAIAENLEFNYEEGIFTNRFMVDVRLDMREEGMMEEFEQLVSTVVYDQFDFGLTLNLPISARGHNADISENNDRHLQWQLQAGQVNEIYLEGIVLNWVNIIIAGIVGALILLLIILRYKGYGCLNEEGG